MAPQNQNTVQPDPAPPCAMVIFGAGGDLTKRLLVPSLYNLARTGLLSHSFALLGVDRVDMTSEAWRDSLRAAVVEFAHTRATDSTEVDLDAWARLADKIEYLQGDITAGSTYGTISEKLDEYARKFHTQGNILFYLAIADRFFAPVIEQLGGSGLANEQDGRVWRRVIIEKPFGNSYESAKALNGRILKVLDERQVYRIDHYLGKETVQNIMVFRFANGIFEPLWNREHIDHIQITVAEKVGVEHRAAFYEKTGALRDMVPNHLFQLLSMTAMEPPNNFAAEAVRTEKTKVLEAAHLLGDPRSAAVRGQYTYGQIDGQPHIAYREEPGVDPESDTETYVAMKLAVDNWRWAGMPFYLRTGKSLAKRASQVVVQFKRAPFVMFRETQVGRMFANRMIIHIQPDEGVSLEFGAKIPGPKVNLGKVSMTFKYQDYFDSAPATGYETLVYDAMIGDATLFQRADAVEAGWQVVQPLLDHWCSSAPERFELYPAGCSGPRIADALLEDDGRRWQPLNMA
jgi:glucose-6-phosphate 1-dehydrogenase